MTLVVSYRIKNNPFLIADLLGTTDAGSMPIPLPSGMKPSDSRRFGSFSMPAGLVQKLVIIDGYIVLGCAGDGLAAHSIVSALRLESAREKFSVTSLLAFLNQLPDLANGKVQMLGWIIGPDGTRSFSAANIERLALNGLGAAEAIGSGVAHYSTLLQRLGGLLPHAPSVPLDSFQYAIQAAAYQFAALNETEVTTVETLENSYGGGFEVVMLGDGRFEKLAPSQFIWNFNVSGNKWNVFPFPLRAWRYSYHDELLAIQAYSRVSSTDSGTMEGRTFIIPPLGYTGTADITGLELPSFRAGNNLHQFFIHRDGSPSDRTVTCTAPDSAVNIVRVSDTRIEFEVDQNWLHGCANEIGKFIGATV